MEREQKSFRLAGDVVEILDRVSRRDGVSQTSIVEDAVRLACVEDSDDVATHIARLRAMLDRLERATTHA